MIIKPSQSDKHGRELEALRGALDARALLHRPDVQGLLKTAYACYSQAIFDSVTKRLRLVLDDYNTTAKRQPDSFRPYGPKSLLSQGDLHLLDQMDNLPFLIDPNKLTTGTLVLGPQGSGKSRLITGLCHELLRIRPHVHITILDPKYGFKDLPNFRHINLSTLSLDLKSPPNVNQNSFIYEFMPILADTCSLIYGLAFLNQAVDISLSQLQRYTEQTDEKTTLCLRDIYEALLSIKVTNFRQVGYHDAAKTALSLILGKQELLSCRGGLPLEWLFSENTVINARSLTNEMQCKIVVTFLLFWLYQRSRNLPETKEIKHVIIIDDATRFIGTANQFGGQKRTSPLGHILAVLRSAGICCIFATQLPAQIDPAVLSLSRNMIVIGNINGEENLRVIQSFMSLTPDQKAAILRFQTREMLAFVSGSVWPYPVHGWAPFVEDLPAQNLPCEDLKDMVIPWHSLTEIQQKEPARTEPPTVANAEQPASDIRGPADKLTYDCITYPFDKAKGHAERMNSFREYEAAKTKAVQNGYLIPSQSGKSLYLIPTMKAYDKFSQSCPFKRCVSIEHGFYVHLATHLLKTDRNLSKVQVETPLGSKGATIDVTTTDKAGAMTAYEVTLSTSNLLSNATKLQDTAYAKIVWLCRDAATAKAVQAYFNKSSALPKEFLARFTCTHFSKFSRQYKDKEK